MYKCPMDRIRGVLGIWKTHAAYSSVHGQSQLTPDPMVLFSLAYYLPAASSNLSLPGNDASRCSIFTEAIISENGWLHATKELA